jgi:8-oxo-dGTP pyrophosphatase MutT (NUDIX family)
MEAAIREIAEETGIVERELHFLEGFRDTTRYSFHRGRKRIDKEVIFFLAEAAHRDVKISDEHTEFAWLPYPTALERVSFEGPRRILEAAETFARNRAATSRAPTVGPAVTPPATTPSVPGHPPAPTGPRVPPTP